MGAHASRYHQQQQFKRKRMGGGGEKRKSVTWTTSSSNSESANEEFEFEMTKHPWRNQYYSSDLEKYASAFIVDGRHDVGTEKMIQCSKQDLFISCMSGFGKMSNYATRKKNCGYGFNTLTLLKMNYDMLNHDLILPTEKFPFGALFITFGKAGFAAILEDGTFYISCHKGRHGEMNEKVYMDIIETQLRKTAEEAQLVTYKHDYPILIEDMHTYEYV